MDIGSQMLFEGKSFKELDWKSVGVSALEGGISGLIGGLTGGTSVAVTTGTAVVKATGKQIFKTAVKTAITEGLLGATVNATSQYIVKGEVNWGDVAMSGIMDTVTGGLGSYLPNTKFGKGIVKFTNKVKDSISTGFKNISDKFDNALKKLGNAFSPEAVTPEGVRVKSPFGLDDVNASNIKYTEVQANYNKAMAEMDVDGPKTSSSFVPDEVGDVKIHENPSELFNITEGSKAEDALGGAYKDVPKNGGQNHHMPADSVSPYSTRKGPVTRMETEDHMQTASWGSSKEAKAYRAKQKELIDQGKFEEAQQMDIDNARELFGDKYDKGIQQMIDYTKKLLSKKKR